MYGNTAVLKLDGEVNGEAGREGVCVDRQGQARGTAGNIGDVMVSR